MKKKILSIVNILIPIILFLILLFSDISEKFVYIVMFSCIIGWLLPFINLAITGLSMLNNNHHKLTLIFNIFSLLLSFFIIFLILSLYDKKMIVCLTDYILISIVNIVNIIYYIIYIKKHPNMENIEIKKIKKENNGIIK